jgi:parallel beta-helix repeat protein
MQELWTLLRDIWQTALRTIKTIRAETGTLIFFGAAIFTWYMFFYLMMMDPNVTPLERILVGHILAMMMAWTLMVLVGVFAVVRIGQRIRGAYQDKPVNLRRNAIILVFLLLLLALLFFLTPRAHAQDDPLQQSIGPDVALLPPFAAALPFVSPETPPILASKAPVGVPDLPADTNLPPPAGSAPACNSSVCIQAALNAGNVLLPQGDYTAANVHVPSNRSIAGVNNLVTVQVPFAVKGFILSGTTNSSIRNLTFVGAGNPIRAVYGGAGVPEFASLIELNGGANHNLITGNRFQGSTADAAILLYGAAVQDADNYNTISGNTFTGCGLYAVAVVSGNNNLIKGNDLTDCSLGAEQDAGCRQTNTGNQFVDNVMRRINGMGWSDRQPFLTGGAATACHYANIVEGNQLDAGIKIFAMH